MDGDERVLLHRFGGAERDRTDDLLLAKQALSQLSYSPFACRSMISAIGSRKSRPSVEFGPSPARLVGGSGWIRTIDPRLIKTVL
jgi:hypothetical protein